MMWRILLIVWMVSWGIVSVVFAEECPQETPIPPIIELSLRIQEIDVMKQRIVVELLVKNVSNHPLVLPLLPTGVIDKFGGWNGWGLLIIHQQKGRFEFFDSGSRILDLYEHEVLSKEDLHLLTTPLQKKDVFTLQPTETLFVPINIAHAKQFHQATKNNQTTSFDLLFNISGTYTVEASLAIDAAAFPDWYFSLPNRWAGYVTSPTETFEIPSEDAEGTAK